MSHPSIYKTKPKYDARYESVVNEVRGMPEWTENVLIAALWLVDNAFSRGCCGDTEARSCDVEDLCAAVEKWREAMK